MRAFNYSASGPISEDEHIEAISEVGSASLNGRPMWLMVGILACAGSLCLLSAYTMLLGIALIGLAVFFTQTHRIMRSGLHNLYRSSSTVGRNAGYTYTITDQYLALEGDGIYVRMNWPRATAARFGANWLLISAGNQSFLFKVEELRKNRILEDVQELCRIYVEAGKHSEGNEAPASESWQPKKGPYRRVRKGS